MIRFFAIIAAAAILAGPALPQSFRAGTGTSVITPFLDEPMAGYYYPRSADGVHDDLRAKALVFEVGGERIVLVACDTVGISREVTDEARAAIAKRFQIPAERVLISATHCHTGPVLTESFRKILARRVSDAVATAMGRMEDCSLYAATEQEGSIAFYRRFFMRDGTVRTNPGFLNPDVVKPAGEIDPRVGVLFAENARKEPLFTWVNYALHLDTVGGTLISADYPYYMGRLLSAVRGRDMLTVFTIGAAGNINHWNVRKPGPQRGNETSRTLGETLGAAVIKAYHHMEPATPHPRGRPLGDCAAGLPLVHSGRTRRGEEDHGHTARAERGLHARTA